MVLFDTNVLSLLVHPDADVPNDPSTGKSIDRPHERVAFLRERLQENGIRILVPAPVLSEFLTFADADYLLQINQSMWFEVGAFDQRAAIEAAVALRRALKSGQGKKLGLVSPWQKIKVDRQIVAVGRVYGVTHVYSTDSDVLTLARESGIDASHIADLPLPAPEELQPTLEGLLANPSSWSPSSGSEQPSSQSLQDGPQKDAHPELDRPLAQPVVPGPPPEDSSPLDPLPPRSEK